MRAHGFPGGGRPQSQVALLDLPRAVLSPHRARSPCFGMYSAALHILLNLVQKSGREHLFGIKYIRPTP